MSGLIFYVFFGKSYVVVELSFIMLKHSNYNKARSIKGKEIIWLVLMPRMCAFSCDSSIHEPACMSIRISCKQRVSIQCVRAFDSSGCLSFGKRNCISCKQLVPFQCGKACDISVRLAACKRNCTDCRQRVSLQNAAACVS